MTNIRIGVVGLDGLSWSYFNKILSSGAMPYTKNIIEKGVKSYLYAFPPLTPPSWTSIMTGVNPAKHGIFDFLYFDKEFNYNLMNSTLLEHPRIHEMLSFINIKNIVINPFPSYPLYKIKNSIQISCQFFTPKNMVSPDTAKRYMKYLKPPSKDLSSFDAILSESLEYANAYLELIEAMLENEEFQLFWINMNHPDRYLHKTRDKAILLTKTVDKECEIFRVTDKIIKKIDENVDNLLIISDHGFSHYKYILELNTLLYNAGYARKAEKGSGIKELWELPEFKPIDQDQTDIKAVSTDNILIRLFLKSPLKPLGRVLKGLYENVFHKKVVLTTFNVDPQRSIAFVPTYTSFAVKVKNVNYIRSVIKLIKQVPGIKNVFLREDLFNGPFIERLPEIYVEPDFDRGYILGGTKITYSVIKKRSLLYHHPLGVFFIKHWNFDSGFPKIIPNYMVSNIIMALFDVPLSYMADGLDLLRKLLNKNIELTDLYLRRWRIIKKLSLVKLK